ENDECVFAAVDEESACVIFPLSGFAEEARRGIAGGGFLHVLITPRAPDVVHVRERIDGEGKMEKGKWMGKSGEWLVASEERVPSSPCSVSIRFLLRFLAAWQVALNLAPCLFENVPSVSFDYFRAGDFVVAIYIGNQSIRDDAAGYRFEFDAVSRLQEAGV